MDQEGRSWQRAGGRALTRAQVGRHTRPSPMQLRQRCRRVVPQAGHEQSTGSGAAPPASGRCFRRSCFSGTGGRLRTMPLPVPGIRRGVRRGVRQWCEGGTPCLICCSHPLPFWPGVQPNPLQPRCATLPTTHSLTPANLAVAEAAASAHDAGLRRRQLCGWGTGEGSNGLVIGGGSKQQDWQSRTLSMHTRPH